MAAEPDSEIWRRAEGSPFAGGIRTLDSQSSLVRMAWSLRANVDLGPYTVAGTIRVLVRDRLLSNPGRRIRRGGSDDSGGTKVDQPGQLHPARRTRWDIDTTQLAGAGRKRHQIRVVLQEGMEFFPPAWNIPPITAKSEAAAGRLVNLETGTTSRGLHFASFWALSEAEGAAVVDEYNIAVVVIDDDNPNFVFPIIIDPPIRNRG